MTTASRTSLKRGTRHMRRGIDVSENNGYIDWQAVKEAGVEFAIVRLGYGNRHLDSCFYDNVNGALDAGLDIGVYSYRKAEDGRLVRYGGRGRL